MKLRSTGTIVSLVLAVWIISFHQVKGQNTLDKAGLNKLSKEKEVYWAQRKANAKAYALQHQVPVRVNSSTGSIELQFIRANGTPAFYITNNAISSQTISTNHVYPNAQAGLELTGQGMTMYLWDAGRVLTSHQELVGRISIGDPFSNITPHFHSTHCAGTLIGSGVNVAAKGMAWEAGLVSYDWNSDIPEMYAEAANGALIASLSYGFVQGWHWSGSQWTWYGNTAVSSTEDYLFGFYDSQAREFDELSNNAPYFLICKSASNDRGEGPGTSPPDDGNFDCIPSDATAKNILTVGAVNDIPGGYTGVASVVMTSFSSWGPTDDGRIKPDICANGTQLYSSVASGNDDYMYLSGTSMSTPSVAGSALLLQQHYKELYGMDMQASTLKALIIHTADETGPGAGPDYMYGWGLMNTRKAAEKISEEAVNNVIDKVNLNNGSSYSRTILSSGLSPVKVTIVWNDPAGNPVSPASLDPVDKMLVNNLDLRIVDKNQNIYYPWSLNPAQPSLAATASAENNTDNVEQVFIANPQAREYTIIVTHNGVLSGGNQIFSIIISGEDLYVDIPLTFNATPSSAPDSEIELSWTKNTDDDDVLLAWNIENTFGDPLQGYPYKPGDGIDGGGMILYHGSDTALVHRELSSCTEYHYRIWSVDSIRRYSGALDFTKKTTGTFYDPPVDLSLHPAGCGMVQIDWSEPEPVLYDIFDSFETYPDFSASISPWKQHDLDGSLTFGISGVTFPNQYSQGSFIIFNPAQTVPAYPAGFTAHTGNKFAICFSAVSPPNNDWLISPKVSIDTNYILSFYARSATLQYGAERFTVSVSTTGSEPPDFTKISTGTYLQAPGIWTLYTYDLTAWAGQDIYVGIHVVSNDAFAFLLDDFSITANSGIVKFSNGFETGSQVMNPDKPFLSLKNAPGRRYVSKPVHNFTNVKSGTILVGYHVFRNGTFLDSVTSSTITTYLDTSAGYSKNYYYVKAVYGTPGSVSGPSKFECIDLSFNSSYTIVNNESFEVIPGDWTEYHVAGNDSWQLSGMRFNSGSKSIYFDDYYSNNNSWLISPPLQVNPGDQVMFNYFENVSYSTWADQQNVMVSDDYPGNGNPQNYNWTALNTIIGADNSWVKKTFDLSNYTGTIYVAFQYIGFFASEWYIDDVSFEITSDCYVLWTGANDNDWSNPGNWSTAIVPGPFDDVLIPDGVARYPDTISGVNAIVNMLEVNKLASIHIPGGNLLEVKGTLINNGKIALVAGKTMSGSLITLKEVNGNGTFELIKWTKDGSWNHLSCPVAGDHSGVFTGNDLLIYDETTSGWLNPSSGLPFDPDPIQGYAIKNIQGNGETRNLAFEGWYNGYDFTISGLTRTSNPGDNPIGMNFIGNPYLASIDWSAIPHNYLTNIDRALYAWDPILNNGQGNWTYYIDGIELNGGSNVIAPGSGFFVRVSEGSAIGEISLPGDVLITSGNTSGNNVITAPVKAVKFGITSNSMQDETMIYFTGDASMAYDADLDAAKMFVHGTVVPQLYSSMQQTGGNNFAINALPYFVDTVKLFLGTRTALAGTYVISLTDIVNFAEGTEILLEDLVLDSLHDIRNDGSYSYLAPGTPATPRFRLIINPVRLDGILTYKNATVTPLNNCQVKLCGPASDTLILQTLADGSFEMNCLWNDNYDIHTSINYSWGGGNSSDALAIIMHFIGLAPLGGLNLAAADVNNNGIVNSDDAYMIQRRFVNMIDSYPSGDWVYDPQGININGANHYSLGMQALCYGDVNGSHTPGTKNVPSLTVVEDGSLSYPENPASFSIPVFAGSTCKVNAISLVLDIDFPGAGIEGIEFMMDDGNFIYNIIDNRIYISWLSMQPLELKAVQQIFNIRISAPFMDVTSKWKIRVAEESEMVDQEGRRITALKLVYPDRFYRGSPTLSLLCFPNPFSDRAVLELKVPDPGVLSIILIDQTGKVVRNIATDLYVDGKHRLVLDGGGLSAGLYYVQLIENGSVVHSEKIILGNRH